MYRPVRTARDRHTMNPAGPAAPPRLSAAVAAVLLLSRWTPSCGADDLDEVGAFVQTVLALADRDELGLPENPAPQHRRPVDDGRLPVGLQRDLERLVGVSECADGPSLVDMLWDDAIAVDEDDDPHDVIDRYRARHADDDRRALKAKGRKRPHRSVDAAEASARPAWISALNSVRAATQ